MKSYKAKGNITFCLTKDHKSGEFGYKYYTETIDEIVAQNTRNTKDEGYIKFIKEQIENRFTDDITDIIDGEKFLGKVLSGELMSYDGYISNIYVNGFKSNLGLAVRSLIDGPFLVDDEAFREICKDFKVEVDWVNK